jgi:hypothetical protein
MPESAFRCGERRDRADVVIGPYGEEGENMIIVYGSILLGALVMMALGAEHD